MVIYYNFHFHVILSALLIEFSPVLYNVTRGNSGTLRIFKRGQTDYPVTVFLSTGLPTDTAIGIIYAHNLGTAYTNMPVTCCVTNVLYVIYFVHVV